MIAISPTNNPSATDEILLEGMRFYAYHGVNPEERALGQRFTVDVALAVDLRRAGQSDDLADTVSYSAVYKLVRRIVEGEPRNLIEAVAESIAGEILAELPPVRASQRDRPQAGGPNEGVDARCRRGTDYALASRREP